MNRLPMILALLILALIQPVSSAAGDKDDELVVIAEDFVDHLSHGEFKKAAEPFDANMRGAAPPKKLGEIWLDLIKQTGPFQAREANRVEDAGAYRFVFISCRFAEAKLDIKVVFNQKSEIAGMFFTEPQSEYQAPGYVKAGSFVEEEITIGVGPWALPGTLTVPWSDGPFPALVLVHGSGPNDRDETIGPNKPFKDLAWGLASRGIAVLRYEKRTRYHAMKLIGGGAAMLTVEQEVIADALAAVTLLRGRDDIDPDRVFVLGHSLGGYLAPRIVERDDRIAGLIVLGGPVRPLEDLLLEQIDYLFRLDGTISAEEDSVLAETRAQVSLIKSYALVPDTPRELLPLGVPAPYWLDLRGYDPVALAKKQKTPMLILQGGRDYQVRDADFALWREGLEGRENVVFRYFADLNHLFMIGEGMSTPAEYELAGHVDLRVIAAVTEWVRR